MSTRLFRVVLAIQIAFLLSGIACNKSSDTKVSKSTSGVPASSDAMDLSDTIVTRIPENAVGFFYWNTTSPAYQKLAQSPWGGSQDFVSQMMVSDPQFEKIAASLKQAGIDIADRKSLESLFTEGVIFAAGAPSGSAAPQPAEGAIALLFRPGPSVNISQVLNTVRKEVTESGGTVSDLKTPAGTGMTFEYTISPPPAAPDESGTPPPTAAATPTKFFVITDGKLVAAGSKDWALNAVLASKGGTLPAVVNSPEYKEATAGFPDKSSRFAAGFFHVTEAVRQTGLKLDAADEQLPLKSVAFAASMNETPQSDLRVLFKPESDEQKKWFAVLNTSSSQKVISAIPSNPLFFLSLDGTTLKKIKELALAQMAEGKEQIAAMTTALDSVKRIGVAARVAPVGQSMLPVPDVMFMIESSSAEDLKQQIQTVAGSMLQQEMGGGTWTEKNIDGTPVKALVHPMGFGIYLASSGNLVLAASTEGQLRSALGSVSSNSAFASKLTGRTKDALADGSTVGNLYLDFQEAGNLATSLQGMLGMFVSQSPEAQSMFDPAKIESIKKMGTMVGSITVGNNLVEIKSFYQPSPKGNV